MEDSAFQFLTSISRMGLDEEGQSVIFKRLREAVCTAQMRRIDDTAVEIVSLRPLHGAEMGAAFALGLICFQADIFDIRIAIEIDPGEELQAADALRHRYAAHGFHGAHGNPLMIRLPRSLKVAA